MSDKSQTSEITTLTADIVGAYVSNNNLPASELPALIQSISAALRSASTGAIEPPKQELAPAVPVKKSVQPDFIVCLEDGRKFKSLKRHLQTKFGMTPDEYRAKWGLPKQYPMVAPAYAAQRSELAKQIGLGQGGRGAKPAVSAKTPSKAAKGKKAAK